MLAEAKTKGWERNPQVQALVEQAQREAVIRSYLASVSAPRPAIQTIPAAYVKPVLSFVDEEMKVPCHFLDSK